MMSEVPPMTALGQARFKQNKPEREYTLAADWRSQDLHETVPVGESVLLLEGETGFRRDVLRAVGEQRVHEHARQTGRVRAKTNNSSNLSHSVT